MKKEEVQENLKQLVDAFCKLKPEEISQLPHLGKIHSAFVTGGGAAAGTAGYADYTVQYNVSNPYQVVV
jgi:hypothetical protein